MVVRFDMKIANDGEARSQLNTPITATIDADTAIQVATAPSLNGGESTTLIFDLRMEPGRRAVILSLDASDSLVVLDLLASDIEIHPIHYQVVEDGKVSIRVRLTNNGTLTSRPVQLIALNNLVATVQPIEPEQSHELSFTIDMQVGTHMLEVTAVADEREVKLSNNSTVMDIEVDYVSLQLSAGSANVSDFIRGGSANVDIEFTVENIGVADSQDFIVAVACPEVLDQTCAGETRVASLVPGATHTGTINAVVPQGVTGVVLFAAELEYGYRWGDSNTIPITLDVPFQPEIMPVFEATAELLGYYSDGDAAITVSAMLRNDGAQPIANEYQVAISCIKGGDIVTACGALINLDLENGFGPAEASTVVRAPAGDVEIRLEGSEIIGVDESPSASASVTIPERIVGVDRRLWRCFQDTVPRTEFPRGNCSGRSGDAVHKWPQQQPVTIWINGLSTYEEHLEDTLENLAPQLNINYQLVPEDRRASILAYVGITRENATSLGFINCDGFWGCANYDTDENGTIVSAEFVVFNIDDASLRQLGLIDEAIDYAMLQSLVQVLVPLGYRDVPDSMMSIDQGLRIPELSASDREIIRILRSPTVKAGDTTDNIEELIVFADEVLEPQEPAPLSNIEIIERARIELYDSDSVLFNMRGGWSGGTCIGTFGPSQVTVSEFAAHRGLHYRLADASERMYVFLRSEEGRAEYWDGGSRTWRRFSVADEQALIDETSWNPQYSDPMVLLASILWFGESALTEVSRNDTQIEFRIERFRAYAAPSWTDDVAVAASLTINLENYKIESFSMEWNFDVRGLSCDEYNVDANLIEYGASLSIPSDVRDRSRVIQ